jgi:hypothetical protein
LCFEEDYFVTLVVFEEGVGGAEGAGGDDGGGAEGFETGVAGWLGGVGEEMFSGDGTFGGEFLGCGFGFWFGVGGGVGFWFWSGRF